MNNEDTLPKWAQKIIGDLRREVCDVRLRLAETEKAHAILTGRSWFTISGPSDSVHNNGKSTYHLWFLDRDQPHTACALKSGDILMIGRRQEKDNLYDKAL